MPGIHLLIKGRVQGVFYRATACKIARGLGLSGWVRNTKEGHVEAVACGNKDKLNQFTDWCRKGPAMARVESLDVRPFEEEHAEGFQIIK